MTDAHDSFREKVEQIFRELAGDERAKWLGAGVPSRCMAQIAKAVSSESGYPEAVGWDIGTNIADWQADAAFLVALHLFPERFTNEEIDEAVRSLLIHVPAHVIAAARLAGYPTEDIFADLEGRSEPGNAPNNDPADRLHDSGVTERPPSVN
jgi:hypothetical protein